MCDAGSDSDGSSIKVNGAQIRHRMLARRVALVVGAVVTELPKPAAPPALDVATDYDRAGVRVAGSDGCGSRFLQLLWGFLRNNN